MPSHIAHALFVEDALVRALPDLAPGMLDRQRPALFFGAQGPDVFYHNRRTKPSGLIYGRLLHTRRYGTFCGNLVRAARSSTASAEDEELLAAFLLGFASHALLDRTAHPYITWFAGWRQRGREETRQYASTHSFLERILDVELLHLRRGASIETYAFARYLEELGTEMPRAIRDALAFALQRTYPGVREAADSATVTERLTNAWADTLAFYGATDPPGLARRLRAHRQELSEEEALHKLAIFHPLPLPGGGNPVELVPSLDPLNLRRKAWTNPCDPGAFTDRTFPELYEQALSSAVPVLRRIARVLRGDEPPESAAEAVGDANLADGKSEEPCRPRTSEPMPLPELLRELYRLHREGLYP